MNHLLAHCMELSRKLADRTGSGDVEVHLPRAAMLVLAEELREMQPTKGPPPPGPLGMRLVLPTGTLVIVELLVPAVPPERPQRR